MLILSNPAKFGLVRTEVLPPEGIANGTVYLCSKVCLCVLWVSKMQAGENLSKVAESVSRCLRAFFFFFWLRGRCVCVCVCEEENKG